MPRVVGVDLALTKTGIGVVTQRADEVCVVAGSLIRHARPTGKAKRAKAGLPPDPTLSERRECMAAAGTDVLRAARDASLVVIYQPLTAAVGQGDARQDVLALWWYVVGPLTRRQVPVAVVNDGAVRRPLTGKGSHGSKEANKVATALAVAKLYPDATLETDDVADALGAAHLGAVALGWNVPTRAGHREVVWTEWPLEAPISSEVA